MKRFLSIFIFGLLAFPPFTSGQNENPPEKLTSPAILLQDDGMVYVDGFYIDIYEYPNYEGAMPKVGVSWEEAQKLCQKQSKRLCTEGEWQQACAGTQNFLYGYGQAFESGRCNTPYLKSGVWKRDQGTARSGSFEGCTSDYGVYDMIGNVWEWTDGSYARTDNWRVVRGGSWFHNVNLARTDARYGRFLTPDYRLDLIGFRCCRSGSKLGDSSD